ncbi:tetratricopeptide repeat protein [Sorangium sp. So ce269]
MVASTAMERRDLDGLTREELIARAEGLGVPRPRVLTKAELVDEILARAAQSEPERARLRGFLGRARDLLSRVVERGLHMPETARALRGEAPPEQWPPPPPPPLPTTTLAEIYASQGHTGRAIAVLDEILARAPHHEEARRLRAQLIEKAQRAPGEGEAAQRAGAGGARDAGAADADDEEAAEDEGEDDAGRAEGAAPEAAQAAYAGAAEVAAPEVAEVAGAGAGASATAGGEPVKGAAPEPAGAEVAEAPVAEDAGFHAPSETPSPDAQGRGAEVVTGAPEAAPAQPPRAPSPEDAPAQAPPVAEDGGAGAALSFASIVKDEQQAEMPARYDLDEIVGIAVDPETLYLYWEVRPRTLARARARHPEGELVIRVVAVLPSWERPVVEQRDLAIDALFGDMFVRDIPAGAHLRMCTGWLVGDVFEPFAVGLEVAAPRALPVSPRSSSVEPAAPEPAALPGEAPAGSLAAPGDADTHAEGAPSPASGALEAPASAEPLGAAGEEGTPAAVADPAASAAPVIAAPPAPSAPDASGDMVSEAVAPGPSGDAAAELAAPAPGRDPAPEAAAPSASSGAIGEAAAPVASGDVAAEAAALAARDVATAAAAQVERRDIAAEAAGSAPLRSLAPEEGTPGRRAENAAEPAASSSSEGPARFPSGTSPTPEALAQAVAATRDSSSEGPARFPSGTSPTPEALAQAVAATRGGASELGRGSGGGVSGGRESRHGGPPHASEALRRAGAGWPQSPGGSSELRAGAGWPQSPGGSSELRAGAGWPQPPGGSSELRAGAGWPQPPGGSSELRAGAGRVGFPGGGNELWRSFATRERPRSGAR